MEIVDGRGAGDERARRGVLVRNHALRRVADALETAIDAYTRLRGPDHGNTGLAALHGRHEVHLGGIGVLDQVLLPVDPPVLARRARGVRRVAPALDGGGGDESTAGDARQEVLLERLVAMRLHGGRGEHDTLVGRDHRGAAELLDQDRAVGERAAPAAVLLSDGEGWPAEVGHAVPQIIVERAGRLNLPDTRQRRLARQELLGVGPEQLLEFSRSQVHGSLPATRAAGRGRVWR